MNHLHKFWDRIANFYAKRPIADLASYQKKLEVTQQYFKPDMEVLEFGCGTGSTAIVHAPFVKHIRGIDVSTKMLSIARSKADAAQVENITFEQLSIDDLNVADASMDAVLGLSILHLLENKAEAIAKVYRMLKPGGIFVSSTVCIGHMKVFRRIAPIGTFLGFLPLLKFFTESELEDAMTSAGFDIDYNWQPDESRAVFLIAKKPT